MASSVKTVIAALIAVGLIAVMIDAIRSSAWPIAALMGVGACFMALDIARELRNNRRR